MVVFEHCSRAVAHELALPDYPQIEARRFTTRFRSSREMNDSITIRRATIEDLETVVR